MSAGKLKVARELTLGFAGIILLGGILLSFPISSRSGVPTPFLNALFTATSATCVTGLVVYDTWSQFSFFGQLVILLLIQCGGLGFMAFALGFSFLIRKRIGLHERSVLTEAMGTGRLGGIVRMMKRILIGTAIFEGTGAVLLGIRFVPEYGPALGTWYAIFHSVSAFCNAGFDILGVSAAGSSLAKYVNDPLVLVTICSLILIGGIGFIVWNDIVDNHFRYKKLKLHTKVALSATLLATIVSMALFLVSEHGAMFRGMGAGQSILDAFFLSVTPRTAGFSICDNQQLTSTSKLLTMVLMALGASPGGTGGGMKTTTVVVALSCVWAQWHNHQDVNVGHFRLDDETQKKALSSIFIYSLMALGGVLVLCLQGFDPTRAMFECLSAIGTVGLSTGITPMLPVASKIVIILLMFFGRVGSLTALMAVTRTENGSGLRQPVGSIVVG